MGTLVVPDRENGLNLPKIELNHFVIKFHDNDLKEKKKGYFS